MLPPSKNCLLDVRVGPMFMFSEEKSKTAGKTFRQIKGTSKPKHFPNNMKKRSKSMSKNKKKLKKKRISEAFGQRIRYSMSSISN